MYSEVKPLTTDGAMDDSVQQLRLHAVKFFDDKLWDSLNAMRSKSFSSVYHQMLSAMKRRLYFVEMKLQNW